MIKGGRQAKLQAKETQSKVRIEKVFMAFNKESLSKLKSLIMPESTNTPMTVQDSDNDFKDAIKGNLTKKGNYNLNKTLGRKSLIKPKNVKNSNDTELLKAKFLQMFVEELERRK